MKNWKKMFVIVCLFFLLVFAGFEDGTSILSRIDTGGFHDIVFKCAPSLPKSNSTGSGHPKHPNAFAFAAQRTKNLRTQRKDKHIFGQQFCDSMSAF